MSWITDCAKFKAIGPILMPYLHCITPLCEVPSLSMDCTIYRLCGYNVDRNVNRHNVKVVAISGFMQTNENHQYRKLQTLTRCKKCTTLPT